MDFRDLDESLLPSFRTARLRALREHPKSYGSSVEEQEGQPAAWWRERLPRPGTDDFVLCGVEAGEVGAILAFTRESGIKLRHRGLITAVYVAPEHRGHGYARALLDAATERAFRMPGLEVVYLGVGSHNEAARRVYEAAGFVTIGEDPYAMRVDGELVPELLMYLARPAT